jgi:uncharacterized protein (TIGR02217 family)
MAITVFSDLFMPRLVIEAGVRGTQLRRNSRVTTVSGDESINVMWTRTLRQYEVGFVPMRRAAWQAIEALHEITHGGAYGFLMKDPKDSYVDVTQGVAAKISVSGYQCYKRTLEPVSGRYSDRKITRPQATDFKLYVNNVEILPGLGFDEYWVNTDTGLMTIPSGPDPALVTWRGHFYVPVHFMDDNIDWQMVVPSQDPDARFVAGPSTMLQEVAE